MLICTKCHCGVPAKEAYSHFKSENHSSKITQTQMGSDLNDYDEWENKDNLPPHYTPGTLCKPVDGLYIYDGFSCTICNYACQVVKSMRNHFSVHHCGQFNHSLHSYTTLD